MTDYKKLAEAMLQNDYKHQEKWLYYLTFTNAQVINRERVEAIGSISGTETRDYVFRTLDILESQKAAYCLCEATIERVATALKWAETAKGGNDEVRQQWYKKGYNLAVHNEASADIYKEEVAEAEDVVYELIKNHGFIGQCIRGEVSVRDGEGLKKVKAFLQEEFTDTLLLLTECVIKAVSRELWLDVRPQVEMLVRRLDLDDYSEIYRGEERLKKLLGNFKEAGAQEVSFFEQNIFTKFQLWYIGFSLEPFSMEQVMSIMEKVVAYPKLAEIRHLNFKPLEDGLYYDYEDRKHVNVYKLRIIEKYLKDNSVENVRLLLTQRGDTLCIDFVFSKVCQKLIDFCVEAERSGLLTFEKSISVLYEMFGFMRDEFDRLNNESKYLATMNDAADSKKSIADEVVGNIIVDVGSGGGVMLDLLEKKYPEKEVIGTDISTNVLLELNDKKAREGHHWNTLKHNFVDGPLEKKVDTVIFSSILHEIYSYTDTEEGKFNIASVEKALRNAYDSLSSGGRIVIRDGVKTEGDDTLSVTLKTPEALTFFKNYIHDFKGLKDVEWKISIEEKEDGLARVTGDVNLVREFLFTYTWGTESYSHEIHEQFGYYTIGEFKAFFESLGAKILKAKEFLEDGYYDHLSETVELPKSEYPCSNCIVVVEKTFKS
ncbi:MAG: methyltransferase [Lachnospiraceae bacterium]|nr:methyltransferase [Lachnospiraceae bacterium]